MTFAVFDVLVTACKVRINCSFVHFCYLTENPGRQSLAIPMWIGAMRSGDVMVTTGEETTSSAVTRTAGSWYTALVS